MEATAEAGKVPRVMDTNDMAEILGVSQRRVQALANHRGVGFQISRGVHVFLPSDIDRLRPGPVGRPPSKSKEQAHERERRDSG